MNKNNNFASKIWSSIKDLFIRLFGFGKAKDKSTINLEEEEIISPSRQIFRNFIRNKVAIIGFVIFIAIVLFVAIGRNTIDFNAAYTESSQIYIEPGRDHLDVPKSLQKSGVKVIQNLDGTENYLMGVGIAHTVAISNDNKIYVWGADIENIKDIPQEVTDNVDRIVQLAVGSNHVVVLTTDGKIYGWGSNGHEQAQIPHYDDNVDSFYGVYKKSIEAYFVPEVRDKFQDSVITTIENDPIKKLVTGYEYTSILTESGIVYTWGNAKEAKISQERYSYRLLDIIISYDEENQKLTWKYNGLPEIYDIATYDEIIENYNIPIVENKNIELRYYNDDLSYRYVSSDNESEEDWNLLATYDELLENVKEVANKKVVDITALDFHLVYEFEDNSFFIMGQQGSILSQIDDELEEMLSQSAEQRGYEIVKVVGTERNVFLLTSTGEVFGWGEYTGENHIIDIPSEVASKKIVDISSGKYHILALDEDGNVYTWGYKNDLNQLDIPEDLPKSKKVISSYFINYSVGEDGVITSWGHKGYIFGTDGAGADIFKRIIFGGAMSLSLALVAVVVSLIIGLIVGLIAGFYGRWVDNLLMRFGEIIAAFPFLPLAMTLAKIVQEMNMGEIERVYLIMVVLGLLTWPSLARLVRGQILKEREQDFVLAAKALGIKERHIIIRHILPNVINVVIVSTTLSYAGALLTESGLSFLGFGVRYPNPSWGNMLTGTQNMTVLRYYWWAWVIPAIFIILTALSVNLVGDGLREAMDPKANER